MRLILLFTVMIVIACTPPIPYHPHVSFVPPPENIHRPRAPFPILTPEEMNQDWAKEMKIGQAFAQEYDYYRAITAFKRAAVLIPSHLLFRKQQIMYDIALCYYLAQKYCEVIETLASCELAQINQDFPAYKDLLIILYDSVKHTEKKNCAPEILKIIEQNYPKTAAKLALGTEIREGHFSKTLHMPHAPSYFHEAYCNYLKERKSIQTGRFLNALLPGTGYWYVGQENTAITALIINGLFIAAAYQFFHRGYTAAGIITASLEAGWYFGGIYGGGRAAAEWNEQKYQAFGEKIMCQEGLFPQVMLRYAF